MVENSEKRDFSPSASSSSQNGDDHILRQIFAVYDRFSAILTRFLKKELSIRPDAELQTVERTTFSLLKSDVSSFPRPLFQIKPIKAPFPVFMGLEAPFLFAAVDRILGSERFAPDHEAETLTAIDRKLAELFIDRLTELLVGFSSQGGEEKSVPMESAVWIDAFPVASDSYRDEVYYLLTWHLVHGGEIFSFVLYLPSEIACRSLEPRTSEDRQRNDGDLSRYIEARKAEGNRPVPLPDHQSDVETGTAEIRVLVGTLEVTPEDLAEMKPGDILTTDIPAAAPFRIRVDRVELFLGRPGDYRGESAVEITGYGSHGK